MADPVGTRGALPSRVAAPYVLRSPATGVLYDVVRGHLTAFVATVEERTDGAGLPAFARTVAMTV